MNSDKTQDFENFDELKKHYCANLPLNIEDIYDKILKILSSKEIDIKDISEVKNDVHKLAGSAGSFGFLKISNILKKLDIYLTNFISDNENDKELDFNYIEKTFDKIRKNLSPKLSNKGNKTISASGLVSSSSDWFFKKFPEDWDKKIVILDYRDRKYLSDLKERLSYFGYEIEFFSDIDAGIEKISNEDIHIIILDTDLVLERIDIGPWLKNIKEKRNSFKIFYTSANNNFKTRLFSLRNSGDAFFENPIDVTRLVNKIEYFADSRRTKPDHILIVDDDIDTLSYYAQLFQKRGMVTSVTTVPASVFNLIVESAPDLIFIDMLMPGCNGIELTAMIRQYDEFLPIPIIIYSAFDRPVAIDLELSFSGYEFISKFTDDETIISTAINRIDRSRNLRYYMERDSLTGLLNHSNINDSFQREFVRAKRTNLPLSYAMIDIDNFKSVNDTYGHFVGDTVLKSLAYMLMERLRVTDIVGRYGGEEFVVIMGNTNVQSAKRVIDEIRENFSKVTHNAFGREFNVTFSCGIAGFPDVTVAKTISDGADKALYIAKKDGKNKVVIYDEE